MRLFKLVFKTDENIVALIQANDLEECYSICQNSKELPSLVHHEVREIFLTDQPKILSIDGKSSSQVKINISVNMKNM